MIQTPFRFGDGDDLPIFVEHAGTHIRFFDDGGVILHFAGRGVSIDSANGTKFITSAAEHHGANLSDRGELEVWAKTEEAPEAFAKFMATLIDLTKWERDHTGASTDAAFVIEEVAQYLMAWKPAEHLVREPAFAGISGNTIKLDFDLGGVAVLVASTHHASVGAALRKILDLKGLPANQDLQTLIILDDRADPIAAKREGSVLAGASKVMDFSVLQKRAGASRLMQ